MRIFGIIILTISILGLLTATTAAAAVSAAAATTPTNKEQSKLLLRPENVTSRAILHVIEQCENSVDIVKCFQIQIAKFLGRALKIQNIKLLDGVLISKKSNSLDDHQLNSTSTLTLNHGLDNLSTKSLNQLLQTRLEKFLENHQISINMAKLLQFGQENTDELFEGRRRRNRKKFLGPFIAAVLLKTAILKMAYHSIAIVAGKALIVGKIALIISAIIGLKKLVSGEGHEKTTYEIVKHPHVQQSHTYSSSHAGEYEGGHESGGGSYHRSIGDNDEMIMQDKAYHAHIPKTII